MDRVSIGKFIGLATISCGSLLAPSAAEGGRFCDWLFHRNQVPAAAYPVPTATTANYGGCCGAGYCEQTVLRYVPQTAYRTVWQPVPVTTYRRTVSCNPANGLPMTCTQPCTSYTYQARRVPYTTFRPVYTTEPVAPVAAPAPTMTYPVAATNYAAPAPSCGCANAPSTPWQSVPQTGQPYYSTPESTPAQGTTPWEPVNSNQAAPAPLPTTRGSAIPGSSDPADRRPRISPDIQPGATGEGYESSSRSLPSIQGGYAAADPQSTSRGFRGSNLNDQYRQPTVPSQPTTDPLRQPTEWNTVRPSVQNPPPASSDNWATDTRQPAQQLFNSRGETRPLPPDVRPLPNLDAPTNAPGGLESSAPPLLNESGDQTASLVRPIPTRWAANRIQWPERQVSYDRTADDDARSFRSTPPPAVGGPRRLDSRQVQPHRFHSDDAPAASPDLESGWRSTRRS